MDRQFCGPRRSEYVKNGGPNHGITGARVSESKKFLTPWMNVWKKMVCAMVVGPS